MSSVAAQHIRARQPEPPLERRVHPADPPRTRDARRIQHQHHVARREQRVAQQGRLVTPPLARQRQPHQFGGSAERLSLARQRLARHREVRRDHGQHVAGGRQHRQRPLRAQPVRRAALRAAPLQSVGTREVARHHQLAPPCGGDSGTGTFIEWKHGEETLQVLVQRRARGESQCVGRDDRPRAPRRGCGRMSLRVSRTPQRGSRCSGALLTICSSTRDCPSASASSSRQRVTSRPTATSTVSPGRRATVHSSQRQLPSL